MLLGAGSGLAALVALLSPAVEQLVGFEGAEHDRIMSCVSQGCGEPSVGRSVGWASFTGWFSAFREPGGRSQSAADTAPIMMRYQQVCSSASSPLPATMATCGPSFSSEWAAVMGGRD